MSISDLGWPARYSVDGKGVLNCKSLEGMGTSQGPYMSRKSQGSWIVQPFSERQRTTQVDEDKERRRCQGVGRNHYLGKRGRGGTQKTTQPVDGR